MLPVCCLRVMIHIVGSSTVRIPGVSNRRHGTAAFRLSWLERGGPISIMGSTAGDGKTAEIVARVERRMHGRTRDPTGVSPDPAQARLGPSSSPHLKPITHAKSLWAAWGIRPRPSPTPL